MCLLISSPLAFIPQAIPMIATPLCRGTCPLSGVTLRKEGGAGNPATRRHGAQSTLQSSSSPETPPSFGGARVGSAAGGSPGSGDCRLMQRGTGSPSPRGGGAVGGCLPGKPSPAPSAPGQSRLGTQACSDSRDVTPAQVPKARREQSQQFFSLFLKKCF